MASGLLTWRRNPSFGRVEAFVLLVYTAVLGFAIHVHEPWGDEAQAWLLARDNSLRDLVLHRLHYEGAPALWHILLRCFIACHGTWNGLNAFAAVFAIAGVFVLLRWSPFPPVVRWLLPFTFFLQYQYAAIARSYVLFGLLLFSVCALWPVRERRPLSFAIVAGLLVNLSFQGFIVAGVIVARALWLHLRRTKTVAGPGRRSVSPGRLAGALAVFGMMCACAVYVAAPAPDVAFAGVTDQVSTGRIHKALLKAFGETPRKALPDIPGSADHIPGSALFPASLVAARKNHPRFRDSPARWLSWQTWQRPNTPMVGSSLNIVLENTISMLDEATWPIARSNLLAVGFLIAMFAWMRARRATINLLPWLLLIVFGDIVWAADHHLGMVFMVLLAAIWITAVSPARGRSQEASSTRTDEVFVGVLLLIIVLQTGWTVCCIRRDAEGAYDPGQATARYLQTRAPGERWAAFHFQSTSVQPYFDHNPFFNLDTASWSWSANRETDRFFRNAIAASPDLILISIETPGPESIRDQWVPINQPSEVPPDYIQQYTLAHGYRLTHQFRGERFARLGSSNIVCNYIFEPGASRPESPQMQTPPANKLSR